MRPDVLKDRNLTDLSDVFDLEDVDELIDDDEGDTGYEGVSIPGRVDDDDDELDD